jgi:hypothetical protein
VVVLVALDMIFSVRSEAEQRARLRYSAISIRSFR